MQNANYGPKILELKQKGASYNEIKDILGCSKGTIAYHLGEGQKFKTRLRTQKRRKDKLLTKYQAFAMAYYGESKNSSKTKNISILLLRKIKTFHMKRKLRKYTKSTFTLEQLKEKIGDTPKCYLTGDSIDLSKGRTYNLDHVIPVSRGGSNDLDNLGLATKQANMSKSDMTYDEYIEHCKKVLIHHGYKINK